MGQDVQRHRRGTAASGVYLFFLGGIWAEAALCFQRAIVVRPHSMAETPCAVSERHRFF